MHHRYYLFIIHVTRLDFDKSGFTVAKDHTNKMRECVKTLTKK